MMMLEDPLFSSSSLTELLEHAPCPRFWTRNHGPLGCGGTKRQKHVGKLVYYDVVEGGSLWPDATTNEDVVLVLEDYDLTATTLDTLLETNQGAGGWLRGLLVLSQNSSHPEAEAGFSFVSPDSGTPQGYGTPSEHVNYGDSAYLWNPNGQGLLGYNLHGLPMALVPNADLAQSIRQIALDQMVASAAAGNASHAAEEVVVAEFDYYVGPENLTSSQECLAWKDSDGEKWNPKCWPLGGTSVWATAGSPPPKSNNPRPVLLVAAAMDSTSLFPDVSPGAHTAASNILAVLMAAKLIGTYVSDEELDALPKGILFGLFPGESYGFLGSRGFLRDLAYPGFQCHGDPVPSSSRHNNSSAAATEDDYACLHPLRPSLQFTNLGSVQGMLAVDQVGAAVSDGLLYVHADENNDPAGAWLANLLKDSSTNDVSVASSSAVGGRIDNAGYPYPPSPLTSLRQLSNGTLGGAVLTGYDYSFSSQVPYHSHWDSASWVPVDLDSVAAAATLLARAALAFAYDDGTYSGSGDSATPTAYAQNLIPELNASDDQVLAELAHCFLYDGQCDLIRSYMDGGDGDDDVSSPSVADADPLGTTTNTTTPTPPNYFVGVYNVESGQPVVRIGDRLYGAYDNSDSSSVYAEVSFRPRPLERTVHGLLNDFLGGTVSSSSNCTTEATVNCTSSANNNEPRARARARAHFHPALDPALVAAPNEPPGFFLVDNDDSLSPLYTQTTPRLWSSGGTVRVGRIRTSSLDESNATSSPSTGAVDNDDDDDEPVGLGPTTSGNSQPMPSLVRIGLSACVLPLGWLFWIFGGAL